MNNTAPLVSVISSAYNHEPYIRQALEGFIMQKTTFRIEVLISDDASTDKTSDIIREYEAKYPDIIRPFYHQENLYSQGINFFTEELVANAQGKYIALCEGDDYWTDPLKLQKQVDFLEKNSEYSLCVGGYIKHDSNAKEETIIRKVKGTRGGEKGFDFNLDDLKKGWITKTLTAVFRVSCLDLNDFIKYKHSRDIHLFYHLLRGGNKGFYLNEVLGVYRIHEGGINSMKQGKVNITAAYNIYKELYEFNIDDFTRHMNLRHSLKLFNYNFYNKSSGITYKFQLKLFFETIRLLRHFKELRYFARAFLKDS